MPKLYLLSVFFILIASGSPAQEPIKCDKKIWVGPDQKIYINKSLPVYLKISVSPDVNAPSYVLPSRQTNKYANPMYFDTEGLNTFRHPWVYDTKTQKYIMPLQDDIFEVYADGIAPVTKIKLYSSVRYVKNGIIYFGKSLKIDFEAYDATSGVETTYVSVNKAAYQDNATLQKSFEEEKEYNIAYYSVDHVGNVELPKFEKFYIDFTPPVTNYEIIGEKKGNVLSAKASIKLLSKDSISGINRIIYFIDKGPEAIYSSPIPISVLKDGKSKIQYYAIDNAGNKEETKVIATSTEAMDANSSDNMGFSYYIDKEPPKMSFEIVGDQYKNKYLFISGQSHVKITATDEKSGVDKIMYSVNNNLLNNKYSEPFTITSNGLNTIVYSSSDYVGNVSLGQTQQVIADMSAPSSKVQYKGIQFTNHDTIFITSNTNVVISANDAGSGTRTINYTIDDTIKNVYTLPFTVAKEGYHNMMYQATDNVGNIEVIKKCSFFVDNIPPEIYHHFSVKSIGEKTVRDNKYEIYPSNAMLYIAATDNASGGEKIEYRSNGKEAQTIIPVKGFKPGNYEVEITACDMLKNKSKKIIRFAIEE